MLLEDYVAECPIKYFKNFIDIYGLDKLKDICRDSQWNDIGVENSDVDYYRAGYVTEVEYTYSEKLQGYCIRFECQLKRGINPKSFELKLSNDRDSLFLTII